jgi:predicted protein tyrosine phosphatase
MKITKTEQIMALTAPYDNSFQGRQHRALFVCSAGLLRSATAATVAAKKGFNTRNCGTASYALIPLSSNLIHWAQSIYFVNEKNYIEALETFKEDYFLDSMLTHKSIVWDIPDCYNYMDPKLVQLIESKLD